MGDDGEEEIGKRTEQGQRCQPGLRGEAVAGCRQTSQQPGRGGVQACRTRADLPQDNQQLKGVLPKDFARPALDKQRLVAEPNEQFADSRKLEKAILKNLTSLGFSPKESA
jgi:hypothetical protein